MNNDGMALTNGRLPLEGVRVVDVTLVWAGPYGTQLLADWGAEVIRVEPIDHFQPMARGGHAKVTKEEVMANKDWGAAFPGWEPGARPWNRSPSFNVHARNKKSMTLNLTAPGGIEVLDRLLALSDVVVENNVPTTGEKLGFKYERLKEVNPSLVVVRMPGFGLKGPYRGYRCLGSHIDGITGHTMVRGYPDLGLELQEDVYYSDAAGGANAALAAVMGLRYRRRTGQGLLIEIAQVENYATYVSDVTMDYLMNGRLQTTLGNRDRTMVPHGCYPCKGEDQWVVISVASEEQWAGLCRAMGNPSWTREFRFTDVISRWRHQDELDELISQWTRGLEKQEAMRTLQGHGVPAGALLDQREVYQDPHLKQRGFFQKVTQCESGTFEYPSIIGRLSRTPNSIRLPPPLLGEHNEYVYKQILGFTDAEYRSFEEAGHIGMDYHPSVP